ACLFYAHAGCGRTQALERAHAATAKGIGAKVARRWRSTRRSGFRSSADRDERCRLRTIYMAGVVVATAVRRHASDPPKRIVGARGWHTSCWYRHAAFFFGRPGFCLVTLLWGDRVV